MHPNARTDKTKRRYIQESSKTVSELSRELNVSRGTIKKWKNRTSTEDITHARLTQTSSVNNHEKSIILFLKYFMNLSVDDIYNITKNTLSFTTSRSTIGRILTKENILIEHHPKIKNKSFYTIKIIFIKPNNTETLIIISFEKSKMILIKKSPHSSHQEVINILLSTVTKYNINNINIAQESCDFSAYYSLVKHIFHSNNIIITSYSEITFNIISKDCFFKAIKYNENKQNNNCNIFNGKINSAIENEKWKTKLIEVEKRLNNITYKLIQAFQYNYNDKIKLRSLRGLTPAQKQNSTISSKK